MKYFQRKRIKDRNEQDVKNVKIALAEQHHQA
jgi:hypothetical protein